MKKLFIYSVFILIFAMVICGAASAATIPVNNITGIQNAINTAHDGDTLNLTAGIYKEHDITVNKNLTISGPLTTENNPPTAVVDAQQQGRVFKIVSGVNVTLKYLLIKNGNVTSNHGGGIYNEGTLTVTNSNVNNNNADWNGGGIYNQGTLTVTNSNVNNNNANGEGSGGGICGGNVTINNSNVNGNTANNGGGIYNWETLTVTNSNVNNNNANNGGGIYNTGKVNITNSTVNNNTSNNHGGGLYNNDILTVTDSNVYNNTADWNGGGIYNQGTLTVTNSKVYNNTAAGEGSGGGICGGSITITNSNVYNNTAKQGGGLYNWGALTVVNSNVYNNTANGQGGGICNRGTTTLDVTGSNLYNNNAKDAGGAIFNKGGTVTLNGSNIWQNTANYAGGIYVENNLYLNGSNIYNNTATIEGGGIQNYGNNVILTNSNIYNNTATSGNGGGISNHGLLTLTNSNIYNNTATSGNGGAIWNNGGPVTVTSSNVYNNTAINGGAIYNSFILTIEFCRITGNTATLGTAIYSTSASLNATLNWWGSNSDPSSQVVGNVNVTPWLTSDNIFLIKSSDPANNAVNVPRNKVITVTFSEPIKAGNMWIELYNTVGTKTLIPITTSISGNVLTINHAALLAAGTKYTLAFHTGSITDLAGNNLAGVANYFTTSTDATPPTITSTDPANNAVNVTRNKIITVTYNEPIKAGTMWIELYNSVGTKTPIAITTSISGNVLTINHAALLANGTKYTLAFHTGSITDLAGNNLAGVANYFTTSTDATPPTITSTDPANNAVNVTRNKIITVTFNEPIKAGTMWIELYNTSGTKTLIPITTSISGNVLTINHAALLANGTKYTLAFHTGSITDLAGNNIAGVASYFTTIDDTAPTITSTDPANNAVNVTRNKVITVTFNEPIKAGTMWIELYNTTGTKTPIPITTSISGNVLTINHAALLANGTKYTLAFHTGSITDLAGNNLAGVARYFTTGTT